MTTENKQPVENENNQLVETEKVVQPSSMDDEKIYSPSQLAWQKFRKNKLAIIGLTIFTIILIIVYIVPLFTSKQLNDVNVKNKELLPSLKYWFGTDRIGRNYFNRVINGGRVSLMAGALATLVSTSIAILVGSIAGYYHGRVDNILMRFAEIVQSFPFLPFAIILSAALGSDVSQRQRVIIIMIVLGILGWTGLARLLRGQILSLREQDMMVAAKALGIKDRNQILRYIVPNVVGIIMISSTLSFANYIIAESSLSFLGFGIREPDVSWGLLLRLATGDRYAIEQRWWLWLFPGVFILLSVLSINLIGEGLRDALDPRSSER